MPNNEENCSICLSRMRHKVTTTLCKHSFCKRCIRRACQSTRKSRCPLCRSPIVYYSRISKNFLVPKRFKPKST